MDVDRRGQWIVALIGVMFAVAVFAGCRIVGQGQLVVVNDDSAAAGNDTVVRAYAPTAGDTWPPAGEASLVVNGTHFGEAPAYAMNGSLYLVNSTIARCRQAARGRKCSISVSKRSTSWGPCQL